MTYFNEFAVNVGRIVFKVVLSSLSVSKVSVPPVNIVKITTTPTYQYINPASKHAIVRKPVFSTSHVDTSPAPVVVTLNCDVPVPENLLLHVRKVSPLILFSANLTTASRCHALIKEFPHFHQQ